MLSHQAKAVKVENTTPAKHQQVNDVLVCLYLY